jgi:NAD-dependent deacetylase
MQDDIGRLIARAAEAIAAARHLVAFTGAGISVESGIPPFRGAGGLWESYDPSILDIGTFRADPETAWKAIKALFYDHWGTCVPNAAHRVLADWEARGLLTATITQNIDGLHGEAGSRAVAEYHGSLKDLACTRCGARRAAKDTELTALPPRCAACGGILKPDFVFFGEGIPAEAGNAAAAAVGACDCLLVIGTSGEVYPAAALPGVAKSRGAVVIELNPKPSAYTARIVDIFLPLGASAGMERLDAALAAATV